MLAFFVVAFFGAAIAFSVVSQLGGKQELLRPLSYYDLWIILCGAVGACGGLFLSQKWLGMPGRRGLLRAVIAIPAVTFFGSLIGGTLALPGYGTMFGPFSVALLLSQAPLFTLLWCASILSAHGFFAIWRGERESIFDRKDDDGIRSSNAAIPT